MPGAGRRLSVFLNPSGTDLEDFSAETRPGRSNWMLSKCSTTGCCYVRMNCETMYDLHRVVFGMRDPAAISRASWRPMQWLSRLPSAVAPYVPSWIKRMLPLQYGEEPKSSLFPNSLRTPQGL